MKRFLPPWYLQQTTHMTNPLLYTRLYPISFTADGQCAKKFWLGSVGCLVLKWTFWGRIWQVTLVQKNSHPMVDVVSLLYVSNMISYQFHSRWLVCEEVVFGFRVFVGRLVLKWTFWGRIWQVTLVQKMSHPMVDVVSLLYIPNMISNQFHSRWTVCEEVLIGLCWLFGSEMDCFAREISRVWWFKQKHGYIESYYDTTMTVNPNAWFGPTSGWLLEWAKVL